MNTRPLYLNGRWTAPGEPIEVVNPATEEPLARVATIDRAGGRQALGDAHAAREPWRKLTGQKRGAYLHAVADAIERRRDVMLVNMDGYLTDDDRWIGADHPLSFRG